MKRHWFKQHKWDTIIHDGSRETQRCRRCGNYRTVKLSQYEQVTRVTRTPGSAKRGSTRSA